MYSIQRMVCVILCVILVVITLTLSVSYFILTRNKLLSILAQSRQDSLSLISQKVDALLSGAYTISSLLARDDMILGTLLSTDLTLVKIPTIKGQIDQTIAKYHQAFSEMKLSYYAVCIGVNGFQYSSQQNYTKEAYQKLRSYSWFQKNIALHKTNYITTNIVERNEQGERESSLAIVRNVFGVDDKYVGSILVCVPERVLYNAYSDILSNKHLYILDALSVVISSSDPSELGTIPFNLKDYQFIRGSELYSIVSVDKEAYFSTRYQSPQTEWTIYEQHPLAEVLAPLRTFTLWLILINLAACLLGTMASIVLARRISRPIMDFCEKMRYAVSNRFTPVSERSRIAEINALESYFNLMSSEILGLMEKAKQREKDISRAKYDFLRAQINPHFLYNTLLSIKCTVSMGRDKEAVEMIGILISLLRNSINAYHTTNSLLSEVEYVTQYVKLQNLRYGDVIHFRCQLAPEMADLHILRFILQPLVENAINHSQAEGERSILMSFEAREDRLLIRVMNNGARFTQGQLDDVLAREPVSTSENGGHIGLYNIQSRIQTLYGPEYGLWIDQDSRYDTAVGIRLPLCAQKGEKHEPNPDC